MPLIPVIGLTGIGRIRAKITHGVQLLAALTRTLPADIRQGAPLSGYSRKGVEIDQIVLHESVTKSTEATVKVLRARQLGVHYMVEPDGTTTEHVSPEKAAAHAGDGHNARSLAVEVVNPYYERHAGPDDLVIDAVWADKKRYIVPPRVQLEAVWRLVRDLVQRHDVRADWPGARLVFRWGRIDGHHVPGIMAHARWAHADGLVPEHYCFCRHAGLSSEEAYELTVAAASSGKRSTTIPTTAVAPGGRA